MAASRWKKAVGFRRSVVYLFLLDLPQLLLTWLNVAPLWSLGMAQASPPSTPGPPPPSPPTPSPPSVIMPSSSSSSLPMMMFEPIPNPNDPVVGMEPFIQAVSERVERVAAKAKENHDNPCGTLEKCKTRSDSLPCLRLTCGYRDNENFTCMGGYDFNTSRCSPKYESDPAIRGQKCDSLWVNFNEPFIRYPSVADIKYPTPVNQTIFQHTCIQKPLRDILMSSVTTDGYSYTGGIYFGSIAGTFITFPGTNTFVTPGRDFPFDCEPYDPRHRPWFAEASSPSKRVSVLVDLTNDMDLEISPLSILDRTRRLTVLNATLFRLTETFREFDTVTFTTFPESYEVDLERVTVIDDPNRCTKFKTAVNNMVANVSSLDLTDGIQRALKKLEIIPNEKNETEILLVFTRGRMNVETAQQAINSYNNRTGRTLPVFLYGVDIEPGTPAIFHNLTKLAENVSGMARNMGLGDPLLGIYSYFDYLSRFHEHVRQPFWAQQYTDAFNLGIITTHIKPVYDSQRHFIGVAAMDVRQQRNMTGFVKITNVHMSMVKPPMSLNLRDVLNLPNCIMPCSDGPPAATCPVGLLDVHDVLCHKSSNRASYRSVKCCGFCMESSSTIPSPIPSPSSSSDSPPPSLVVEKPWFQWTLSVITATTITFFVGLGVLCFCQARHRAEGKQ